MADHPFRLGLPVPRLIDPEEVDVPIEIGLHVVRDEGVRTKTWTNKAWEGVSIPSYTKEQRERALEVLRQCDGRVTQAITRLGYPPRQTTCQWIRGETAAVFSQA